VIYPATWDYMTAGFKFYVDEGRKLVVFAPETDTIDIKLDLYKALKEWFTLLDNSRYQFPIRTIGGDPTTGSQTAGDSYFMINGYRCVYDVTRVKVTGILYSDDYDTPWLQQETLQPVYPASVSNLALAIAPSLEGLSIPTAIENATAVWAATIRTLTEAAGLTAAQDVKLDELHKLQGLDSDNPMTVTPTSRDAGSITQVISGDGETTSTVTRQ
jgi:hypothetical protein